MNSFLRFIGNPDDNSIEFSSMKNRFKNKKIEVDEFATVWKLLNLLNDGIDLKKLNTEAPKIGVPQGQLESWLEILNEANAIGTITESDGLNKKYLAFLEYLKANGAVHAQPSEWIAVVVGVGTVGSTLVGKLIEHGVRKFTLIDPDFVGEENLGTQRFYRREHLGTPKCEALAKELAELFHQYKLEFSTEISTLRESKEIHENLSDQVVVFLAADEIRHSDKSTMKAVLEKNVHIYHSGYGIYMSGASVLKKPEEVDAGFTEFPFEISQNAGMSIEGDIAASLMVRMWVNEVFLNKRSDRQHIDTMFPSGKYVYTKPIVPAKLKKADEVQLAYINFIKTGDENDWKKVEMLDENFDFLEKHSELYEKHEHALTELKYDINGEKYNAFDTIRMRMSSSLPEEIERALEVDLPRLVKTAYDLIAESSWNLELSQYEFDVGAFLSQKLVKEVYDNIIDFAEYTPFKEDGISFSLAKDIVADSYAPANIDFLFDPKYLLPEASQDVSIFRYVEGRTYILLDYQDRLTDLLSLAHEIGHAYYNHFVPNKYKYSMDEVFSEICAFVSEFRLLETLKTNGEFEKYRYLSKMKYSGILLGYFSLLIYRKEVFEIVGKREKWDVKTVRRSTLKKFLPDATILNPEVSDYNVLTALQFLSGENVGTYVKALLYASGIFENYEDDLIEYIINCEKDHCLDGFIEFIDIEKQELLELGKLKIINDFHDLST